MPGDLPLPDQRPSPESVSKPWGGFRQYAHNQAVTVSLMTVAAGQRLSLQSHESRAELWIALDDDAVIEIDGAVAHAKAGDEFWIPAGAKHRLGSAGAEVRVLEVAYGDWRADDIQRYADDYGRLENDQATR